MGLRVVNRIYTDIESRTGDSMQANYLDPCIAQYDVEYDAKLDLSSRTAVIKEGNKFTLTVGTWYELIGAFAGANIDFIFASQGNATSTTIDYVNDTEMVLVSGGGSQDGVKTAGYFQVTDVPELFEVDFNLVLNEITGTTSDVGRPMEMGGNRPNGGGGKYSLIDGETQRFSVVLANALTVGGGIDNFIQLGFKSGGSTITATIDRIADVGGNKRYTILVNYKNWVLLSKTPYIADNCVGDYIKVRATGQRGNDNVFLEVESKNIGDTGFEDESLNGGIPDYVFTSIVWTDDSANVMDAMDYTQPSNFVIVITGAFTTDERYGIKLFRLPEDPTEYQNLYTDIEDNLSVCMNDTLIAESVPTAVTGNLDASGAAFDISGFDVTNNTTTISIAGKITPNAAMITLLTNRIATDRQYKLVIGIDDSTKVFKDVNTVNVLVEEGNAVKDVIPLGTWGSVTDFDLIDVDGNILSGTPDLQPESFGRMNVTFTLPKDLNNDNPWISLAGQIVCERTNGERFTLESYVYDISNLSAKVSTQILPIAYSQASGWCPPVCDNISFALYPSLDDASNFGIQLTYGFQVGFQTWIDMPDVSDYFALKNNNWEQYSSDAAWQMKFELVLTHDDGVYTNVQDFGVLDYNDATGTAVWTYEDPDAVAITKPYGDKITKVTVTYTTLSAGFLGNEFAVISVRDTDGNTLGDINTIAVPSTDNNPLQPIAGETELKITVATKVMTLVCNLDPSKISVKDYTLVLETRGDT